jgi:hypothetical protein
MLVPGIAGNEHSDERRCHSATIYAKRTLLLSSPELEVRVHFGNAGYWTLGKWSECGGDGSRRVDILREYCASKPNRTESSGCGTSP